MANVLLNIHNSFLAATLFLNILLKYLQQEKHNCMKRSFYITKSHIKHQGFLSHSQKPTKGIWFELFIT